MALSAGRRLGAYEIVSPLGAGGMGEVYRARDTKLNRDVALKVLPEHFALDADRLARFKREAQVLASLNHPNIGIIHGLEDTGGVTALVLELVEGPTLADRIAQGPIPIDEALPVARQIADALEAAHEHGIIHRDLKPANIKLRPDGTVKVLDFGLAKALDSSHNTTDVSQSPTITSPAMTGMGVILGTAAYMAPEQAKGRAADKRSDIWAFGCVLYEMLTGRRAFHGEDVSDTLAFILTKDPEWIKLPANTPGSIRKLLRRCLEKDRKRRLADVADARLEIDEALTAPDAELTRAPGASRGRRERIAWSVAGVLAVLSVIALIPAILYIRRALPESLPTRFEIVTPPTGNPTSFALSPDGRQLAFVATAEGAPRLWVRPLDRVTAQALAGTEGAGHPFWAPDGRAIGFFADRKLKRIDLATGSLQVLADAPADRGGTWSRDGVIVFAPTVFGPLMRVAATGGAPAAGTRFAAGQGSHRWPQFLPDGRRFLFFMGFGSAATRGVYVGTLEGGEPTRVLEAETAATYAPPGALLLVRQGVLVALGFDQTSGVVSGEPIPVAQAVGSDPGMARGTFAVSANGVLAHRAGGGERRQLVWVDRAGTVRGTLGPPDENALGNPELAPDGRRVAVQRAAQGNVDVWLFEIGRGVPSRFTFDAGADGEPLWSPDGRRVAFRSSRNAAMDLFEKPASGAADEQPLLVTAQPKTPLAWSPDGRLLLYVTQDPNTGADLWALPVGESSGEHKPTPVLHTAFDEAAGQFSPDGHWLAYTSNESGSVEVYVRPFAGPGGNRQVSIAGGNQPRWRPDGKELFYIAPDGRLMAASIAVGADKQTLETGTPVPLFATRLASGAGITGVGALTKPQYAVAPDGRFLMNVAVEEATAPPITVVLNWDTELKK